MRKILSSGHANNFKKYYQFYSADRSGWLAGGNSAGEACGAAGASSRPGALASGSLLLTSSLACSSARITGLPSSGLPGVASAGEPPLPGPAWWALAQARPVPA